MRAPSLAARRDGAAPSTLGLPQGGRVASRRLPGVQPDGSGRLMLAWILSVALFLGFAAALVLYRIEIIEAWPPAERLYVALGMMRR